MFDIKALADQICISDHELAGLNATVEKELLHYEVIATMSQHGFLNDLTFQGGTCLRMMYGANRLSEDLDFAGGEHYDFNKLSILKSTLQETLSQRHNLRIYISEPDLDKFGTEKNVNVGRWKIAIETEPQKKDAPWQKVKLEVATVKAHTKELRPLTKTYPDIPDAYTNVLINCETLEEIAADKIVALALRRSIKARDLWDMAWLAQRKIYPDRSLVQEKFENYRRQDGMERLNERLDSLPGYMSSGLFENEMSRFVHSSIKRNTVDNPSFNNYIQSVIIDIGNRVLDAENDYVFKL